MRVRRIGEKFMTKKEFQETNEMLDEKFRELTYWLEEDCGEVYPDEDWADKYEWEENDD